MNLFRMDGPRIYRQGARLIGPFLDEFLRAIGWTRVEIAALVPHQASRHAIDLLTDRLGFTPRPGRQQPPPARQLRRRLPSPSPSPRPSPPTASGAAIASSSAAPARASPSARSPSPTDEG
jgi:hypothetical protein